MNKKIFGKMNLEMNTLEEKTIIIKLLNKEKLNLRNILKELKVLIPF